MRAAPPPTDGNARAAGPWERLHQALMPDYNRKAATCWWTLVVLGAAVLLYAAFEVAGRPWPDRVQILGGMMIATLAGMFPVRIGQSKSSFAAGEVFILLLLLLHGPAAAALAAGCETLVGAMRTSKRWTSRLASPAISATSMFTFGTALTFALAALEGAGYQNPGLPIALTMVCALLYFAANSLLVTAVPRLKRDEWPRWSDMLTVFGWVGITFAGSGAVAGLMFITHQLAGFGVLIAVLPIMAMLLATLHYYNRQQEAHDAMRRAAEEAAAREAENAARATAREAEAAARHLRQLEDSERRFHSAFTHASIGMALLNLDGRVLQSNDALGELLHTEDTELRQHRIQSFVVAEDVPALEAQLARLGAGEFEDFTLELRCRRGDGREVWVAAHCSYFSEPGSEVPCLILQVHDIDARRQAEAGLHQLAFHDALTGLPNRRRFGELLTDALAAADADPQRAFAVMFLDFDRFKLINDSLGHNAGDEFLVQVARRLVDTLRPGDVVARLGGDEFAVLAHRVCDAAEGVAVADRLLQALRRPFVVAGSELNSSASIGITLSSMGYRAPEEMLRDADTAMYKAKFAGKARYALFDSALHTQVAQRLRLEGDLRRAIEEAQVQPAYQPLYELASARLVGFEALARWMHPELGPIGPDVFIPIAEESGLVIALTDLMLHRACRDLRSWQLANPAFAHLSVNVNISAKDLMQPGFVARVTHALVDARLEPAYLTIELTENILMAHLETALPMLEELRALGVGLSVDDFGTGYSSLAHLSNLPVDSLKVDRSFIRNLRHGTKDATVVRAVVNLGNSLGKHVVAEGIETASQFGQLREMGCAAGQGYHLSRPLPPAAVRALLERTLAEAGLPALAASPVRPALLH